MRGRVLIGAAVGTALAGLLSTTLPAMSDGWWTALLPWALLAVFWTYLLVRYRRGTLPGLKAGPTPPVA